MATKPLPDVETLRKLLDYDPKTGLLTWKTRDPSVFCSTERRSAAHSCRQWNDRFAGTPALARIDNCGYPRGALLNKRVLAHRIAWAIYYGEEPATFIDHINGNRADNRIANLRLATRLQNMKNQKLNATNKSGVMGVRIFKATGKWHAQIKVGRKNMHLGYFDHFEDAVAARKKAEALYGFDPNHGHQAASSLPGSSFAGGS
jgi:hypothetical protein